MEVEQALRPEQPVQIQVFNSDDNVATKPSNQAFEAGASSHKPMGEGFIGYNHSNNQIDRNIKIHSPLINTEMVEKLSNTYAATVGRKWIESIDLPSCFKIILENYEKLSLFKCVDRDYRFHLDRFGSLAATKYDGHVRLIDDSTKRIIVKGDFLSRSKRLVTFLLFINEAIWRGFEGRSILEKGILPTNIQLVELLAKEIYQPDSSLPLIGLIKKHEYKMDETAFQEFQINLINYLSQKKISKEKSFGTAFNLIFPLIQKHNPQAMNLFKDLDGKQRCAIWVEFIEAEIYFKRNKNHCIASLNPADVGNFLPVNPEIPLVLIPKKHFNGINSFKNMYVERKASEMCTQIKYTYKNDLYPHGRSHRTNLKNVPISFMKVKNTQLLMITNKLGQTIKSRRFLIGLNSLLTYSLFCHSFLMNHLSKNSMIIGTLEESQISYLDWFKALLLGSNQNLPILGLVNYEIKLTSISDFNFQDSQKAMIHYISLASNIQILPQISIGLNRIWFKENYPVERIEDSLNDKNFANTMIDWMVNESEIFMEGFRKKTPNRAKRTSSDTTSGSVQKKQK